MACCLQVWIVGLCVAVTLGSPRSLRGADENQSAPEVVTNISDVADVVGHCEFDNEPVHVGHYWDPACQMGDLGCDGDGKHVQCRLCGAGDFLSIQCPASSCSFQNEPYTPYYWESECELGQLGCWADGVHKQCRFCGDFPFTGVTCPEGATHRLEESCAFVVEPTTPYYWDPTCYPGKHGCNADGKHVHCRFCGQDGYADIVCPGSQVCEFDVLPSVPFYWDAECQDGMLGCKADGVHPECRFCAQRPYETVPCPEGSMPPQDECTWPQRGEPSVSHFWDETCEMGRLGCWADGIHAECRFCGSGVYRDIACPNMTSPKKKCCGYHCQPNSPEYDPETEQCCGEGRVYAPTVCSKDSGCCEGAYAGYPKCFDHNSEHCCGFNHATEMPLVCSLDVACPSQDFWRECPAEETVAAESGNLSVIP